MWTALLDILTRAGVLADDNIAKCNGLTAQLPARVDKINPRTLVWIWER
jgi:hypothetical protein